jgi:hypothetical protein
MCPLGTRQQRIEGDGRERTRELALCRLWANTAPGLKNRAETEQAFEILKLMGKKDEGVPMELNDQSEVYHLRDAVWKAAGMAPFGGCLCIGCLEKRLGRQLRPKDFDNSHDFNRAPGTPRLMERRTKKFKPRDRLALA